MVNDKDAASYAIIKSGGKQYRVKEGDIIDVELIEVEQGGSFEFPVLFLCDGGHASVGAPTIAGAVVVGKLLDIVPGPKVTSVKYKRSHHQYRKFGHRQKYSRFRITEIATKKGKESRHHGT